jgi:hypothetical protein
MSIILMSHFLFCFFTSLDAMGGAFQSEAEAETYRQEMEDF